MNSKNLSKALDVIEEKILQIHALILSKPHLREFADTIHPIPRTYYGGGKIKLIIIGQDPTVKNKASRKRITTALDLDKEGKMQRYIFGICKMLGVDPYKELYATNLFKNFFDEPPVPGSRMLDKFAELWLPVLQEEIALFPRVPVITKGDHILEYILNGSTDKCVRNYWGYIEDWKIGINHNYKHVLPDENKLGRLIFPFPRQPSILKQFYMERCESYIEYVKSIIKLNTQEAA